MILICEFKGEKKIMNFYFILISFKVQQLFKTFIYSGKERYENQAIKKTIKKCLKVAAEITKYSLKITYRFFNPQNTVFLERSFRGNNFFFLYLV